MSSIKQNNLYPVFFRLDKVKMLIVGAGEVGEEKLRFILKSSPDAQVTIVATWVGKDVQAIINGREKETQVILREVRESDVVDYDLIVAATNFPVVNQQVYRWAKSHGKIINVADTPDMCDFYMGSIVTRGNLKIAISTNGKSPTFSKRFRQVLESILPPETDDLLTHLEILRDRMKGNFEAKVKQLNELTKSLING